MSYLIFLACIIRSSIEASDASVRALKHYLSDYERTRLRRRWMRTYVKLRKGNENATKTEIIWAVFVDELHKHGMCERPHLMRDQLRLESMENYLEKSDMYEPFQMCMLSTLDRNGNTQLTPFLRAALGNPNKQLLNCLETNGGESDTNAEDQHRTIREESNHSTWMLTAEEKTEEQLRDYRDQVWKMSVQNQDYIRRSKAL
ncbi:hypothetical protein Y032_0179g737 [Ancylostoma ceylanicum]|nr:hypothetical protein Y032_0179g737 [Ancylostoma ceylanicum]